MHNGLLRDSLYEEELKLEQEWLQRGVARYRKLADDAIKRGAGANLKPAERLMAHWFETVRRKITQEKADCTAGRAGKGRQHYGKKHIHLLPSDELAVLTMHTAISQCMEIPEGPPTTKVAFAIGRAVSAEVHLAMLHRENAEAWHALLHTDRKQLTPQNINKVANKYFPEESWLLTVQATLGMTLLDILRSAASTAGWGAAFSPAFQIEKRWRNCRSVFHLALTDAAEKIIDGGHRRRMILSPRYGPMVVPPMAWTDNDRGGYLSLPMHIITHHQRHDGGFTIPPEIREAVNALNSTPWRINERILDVVRWLWQGGGNVAGIPRARDLDKPTRPTDWETNEEAKKAWKKAAVKIHRNNVYARAERSTFLTHLATAEQFAQAERFYLPHQLDFRGRAYAMPAFNHQQGDVCRGLLEFADPVTTGPEGQQWLMIHMANCCGIDKVDLDTRVAWVKASMDSIEGWATDPTNNTGWLEQDKPFQALAAAMALTYEDAAGHLPVQVDGSNNALQHYGAMLRCEETAGLVNLIPGDMPSDVYAEVAHRVAATVAADAAQGNALAKILDGQIGRKLVKQPTMTSVYGVTRVGIRRQLADQLREMGMENQRYELACYLGEIVRSAVAGVCTAAHKAMEWFAATGRVIAKAGRPIEWTTPLGMVVSQPYRSAHKHIITTAVHKMYYNLRDEQCPVAVQKQINGFAPSFVHSLDASHMACSALACRDAGLRFAAVHDSYWTHAEHVPMMNTILREQFVLLHETPALDNLHTELCRRHPDLKLPPPPHVGALDLVQVTRSKYFFA